MQIESTVLDEAEAAYRRNERPRGFHSSPNYDASLILQHVLYWSGMRPKAIHTSHGYNFRVEMRGGQSYTCRVTDYNDHREGVAGFR